MGAAGFAAAAFVPAAFAAVVRGAAGFLGAAGFFGAVGFFAAGVRPVVSAAEAARAAVVRGVRGGAVAWGVSVESASAAFAVGRRGARGVVARGARGLAGGDTAASALAAAPSVSEEDFSGGSGSDAVIAPNYQPPPTPTDAQSRAPHTHR